MENISLLLQSAFRSKYVSCACNTVADLGEGPAASLFLVYTSPVKTFLGVRTQKRAPFYSSRSGSAAATYGVLFLFKVRKTVRATLVYQHLRRICPILYKHDLTRL